MCQKGFYFPDKNSTTKSFPGSELEQAFLNFWNNKTNFSNVEYQCLPCPRGCENCVDDTRCMAEYNVLLRGIPLGIQSFCITVTIVIGIVVLRLRKSKVNASYISVAVRCGCNYLLKISRRILVSILICRQTRDWGGGGGFTDQMVFI